MPASSQSVIPLYVAFCFLLLTAGVLAGLLILARQAWTRAGARRPASNVLALFAVLGTWLVIVSVLAGRGFYLDVRTNPARLMLLPGILVTFTIVSGLLFRDSSFFRNVSLFGLAILQSFRLVIESVIFHGLYQAGTIPLVMTLAGRNYDLLVGLSAPLVAYLLRRGSIGNRGLLVWNAFSLLLLLNIVVHAVLSTPTPFQAMAFEQPNVAVLRFPYVLLPAFLVPVAFFGHFVSLVQLLSRPFPSRS